MGSTQVQERQGHPSELIDEPFNTAKVANVLSGNYPETILHLSGMGVVSTWGQAWIKKVKEIHQNELESLSKLHLQRLEKVANVLFRNYPEHIWNGVDRRSTFKPPHSSKAPRAIWKLSGNYLEMSPGPSVPDHRPRPPSWTTVRTTVLGLKKTIRKRS